MVLQMELIPVRRDDMGKPAKIILSVDEFITILGGVACQRLGIKDDKIHAEVDIMRQNGQLHSIEVTISDWIGDTNVEAT